MKTMEDLYKLDKKYRTDPLVVTKDDEKQIERLTCMLEGFRTARSVEVRK